MHIGNGKKIGFIISLLFWGFVLKNEIGHAQVTRGYFEQGNAAVISIRAADGIRVKSAVIERISDSASGDVLAVPEKADTLRLFPSDDAFISVWNRDENYGNLSYLDVLGKGGRSRGRYFCCTPAYEFVSYLRFEIPDFQGEIVSAKLHLFCDQGNHLGGIFYLNPVESSLDWSEKTITWNNRPNPLDDPQTFLAYQNDSPPKWSSYDVTNAFLNNWNSYTFVIAMQETRDTQWSSKEGQHPPFLEIAFIKNNFPYVESIEHNSLSPTSVVFNWQTNVMTRFHFAYGNRIGQLDQYIDSSQFQKDHAAQLDSLLPGTKYYYIITVSDPLGHLFATQLDSFVTSQYDRIPPTIEVYSPHSPTSTSQTPIEIRGKISDSDVLGIDINGIFYHLNTDRTFYAKVALQEGKNQIILTAEDFSRNVTRDTLLVTLDTMPPILLTYSVSSVYAASATISWNTNEPSVGFVTYGPVSGQEDTLKWNYNFSVSHVLSMLNLNPETRYSYFIHISDSLGNSSMLGPYSFITKSANQIKFSIKFDYFGDFAKPIDDILVSVYADGKKADVDTAKEGALNDLDVVFENQCELEWLKVDSISAHSAIHMYDAALTALYSIGRMHLDSLQKIAADVDLNTSISMYDAAQIARFSVGLPVPRSSHVGQWKFLPDSIAIVNPDTSQYKLSITGILLGDVHNDWQPESHLTKNINLADEEWLKQKLSFCKDTLIFTVPLGGINNNAAHFSFFIDMTFSQNEWKFLDYSESGSQSLHIFQNSTDSNLKIGGFATHSINGNSIRLRFVNHSHKRIVEINKLCMLIDGNKILDVSNLLLNKEKRVVPNSFELFQNYPNPFNGTTEIRFAIPKMGKVTLTIFNQNGDVVKHVVSRKMIAGLHRVSWNGADDFGRKVSSGLYFARIIYEGRQKVSKLLYLK